MKKNTNDNNFIWLPKILSIVFILFISIFALDVWAMEVTLQEKIIGFIIHLIPSFILLVITLVAWKHPFYGGLLFIIISIGYTLYFSTFEHIASFLIISLPPLIIGILYIISKR